MLLRHSSTGPAVRHLRARLATLDLLDHPDTVSPAGVELFDDDVENAVRLFQQSRGLVVDGLVGPDTLRTMEEASRRLGDRLLYLSVNHPFVGDDVLMLQQRLANMGFNVGRCDGIFGKRTESGLRELQRNRILAVDGTCGPVTLRELERLARTVVGGRPHELREDEHLRRQGPSLSGKTVVIDPGHGGDDTGGIGNGLTERDVAADIASQLEGRLLAAGVTAYLTHGPAANPGQQARAEAANSTDADLLMSLHVDAQASAPAQGVATYYFGTAGSASVVGERLAELVQREIVARTGLVDGRTHPKTWELLRRTRMPAVRVEIGYLSNEQDAAALSTRAFRATIADALLAAVQRLFLPEALDPETGAFRLPMELTARIPTELEQPSLQ